MPLAYSLAASIHGLSGPYMQGCLRLPVRDGFHVIEAINLVSQNMGCCVSGPCAPCACCGEKRTKITLEELKDMDIVLIRSGVKLGGNGVDARAVVGMQFNLNTIYHELYQLEKFDTVGIIMLPDDEEAELNTDSILVTLANCEKIATVPLSTILDSSLDVYVRQLYVKVEKKKATIIEHDDRESNALMHRSSVVGSTKELTRPEMVEELYTFIASARRPYGKYDKKKDVLQPMIAHTEKTLRDDGVQDSEIAEMRKVLDTSGVGDPRKGFTFDDILQLFDHIQRSKIKNTFSESDVRAMATYFKNFEHMSREDFFGFYRESLARSLIATKKPTEVISGAFISLVLQRLNILRSKQFFMPMDFAFKGKAEEIMEDVVLGKERILKSAWDEY